MQLDDEVCLCFHVTKRKLLSFLRVEKPRRPAQMSECFGAGTGCGWCRRYLERLFEATRSTTPTTETDLDAAAYSQARAAYIRAGGGTPPAGATPIEPDAP